MQCIWSLTKVAALCAFFCACSNQIEIQRDYVSQRNQCQLFAESTIGNYLEPNEAGNPRVVNAKLVTLFSDCMFEHGWTVATPKREGSESANDTTAQDQALEDDLPQLNDVPAGRAATAGAPEPSVQKPTLPTPLMQPERRVPRDNPAPR